MFGMETWRLVPRVFSIVYSVVAVYFLMYNASLFALHPFLMTIAFIVLMAEGIQIFHSPDTYVHSLPRERKINLHFIIQVASCLTVALGFICIYVVKVSNGKNHFTTWHGTIGVVSCACVACSALGGIINSYRTKLTQIIKPYRLKRMHKSFGVITFLLGLTSIAVGLTSTWAERELNTILRGALISFLFPFGISVVYIFVR